jgi:hypothetical protein
MNETTQRFLRAIVERLPEGRVAELRLFPAIRQGGMESAVAVIAVEATERALDSETHGEAPAELPSDAPVAASGDDASGMASDEVPDLHSADRIKRYAILTAHYRLTLKGPDRGRWEVDLVHEADAPLETLERVARGVARRAGDAFDPELFSADALRHALEQPAWAVTT